RFVRQHTATSAAKIRVVIANLSRLRTAQWYSDPGEIPAFARDLRAPRVVVYSDETSAGIHFRDPVLHSVLRAAGRRRSNQGPIDEATDHSHFRRTLEPAV